MAEIAGFRGLLYNASTLAMSDVLAPPYDVIDEASRGKLVAQHENNCVRIIMPRSDNGDADDSRYEVARRIMETWQSEGVLVRDEAPAVYRYHQVFRHEQLGDALVVRRGFIAAVRLHDFEEGVILRHERTLRGPKLDRLNLWNRTRCHLSQIFTLYADPDCKVDALFSAAESCAPLLDGTTADGTRHILWRVSDPETLGLVVSSMEDKSLYIADGHHRYETMLALRDSLLKESGEVSWRSSVRFGMMFLANLDDPGLVVLPTHRMIHGVEQAEVDGLRERLTEFFLVQAVDLPPDAGAGAVLVRALLVEAAKKGTSFVWVIPGGGTARVLTLRPEVDLRSAGLEGADSTLALDVTLLHGLVLERMLKIDRAAQEAQTHIDYLKDTREAMKRCYAGEGQGCFFMNATPVSQVVAVSDDGEVMPQKSTFFYPKIASGMVFNPISISEEV